MSKGKKAEPLHDLGTGPLHLQLECRRGLAQVAEARQEDGPQASRVGAISHAQGLGRQVFPGWQENRPPHFQGHQRHAGHVPEQRVVPGKYAVSVQLGPAGQDPVLIRYFHHPSPHNYTWPSRPPDFRIPAMINPATTGTAILFNLRSVKAQLTCLMCSPTLR